MAHVEETLFGMEQVLLKGDITSLLLACCPHESDFFPNQTGIHLDHFQHDSVMSFTALGDFIFVIPECWKLLLWIVATQLILPVKKQILL